MEKKIKLEHFANIVAVAASDGVISNEELELLKDRAIEYGLNEKDVNDLIDSAESLEFIIPMNLVEKEDQLSEAVLMSMIDGEIHQHEYKICLKIAEKLGFDEKYLNHIVELSKKLSR
ncbi:MAG: TerB family tellurite resistance protein [Bacteroidales bacterium]|nr:TerB family tellurite resistance protein [Bacteroidales bacterium]